MKYTIKDEIRILKMKLKEKLGIKLTREENILAFAISCEEHKVFEYLASEREKRK